MRTMLIVLGGIASVLAGASVASARPYSVVARYGPSPTKIEATLTLDDRQDIPDGGAAYDLQTIAVHFEPKPFGLFPAEAFESFVAEVSVNDERCTPSPVSIKLQQLEQGGDYTVCAWRRSDHDDLNFIPARVKVKAKLSRTLLCALEARHRDLEGDRLSAAATAATINAPYSDRGPARTLKHDGRPLVASFCHAVDWKKAATPSELAAWEVKDAASLQEAQERALFARLEKDAHSLFSSWTSFDAGDIGAVTEVFDLTVFRAGEIFEAYELSPDGQRDLSSVIDVESDLSFASADSNQACPNIRYPPFRYTVSIVGDGAAEAAITPVPIEMCEVRLPLDMTKLHDRRLRIRALYSVDDGGELVIYEREFSAHELGFSWSAPIVSEIRAAVNGWSKDEFRAQSSLPLSWAIGLGAGTENGIAVTIPAKITYATRRNPNLAEMFSFYPHVSVLVTEGDDGKTPVTFSAGVGISLVNSFYFSYALGFSGPHDGDHFILIGLDIKDLAGLKPGF